MLVGLLTLVLTGSLFNLFKYLCQAKARISPIAACFLLVNVCGRIEIAVIALAEADIRRLRSEIFEALEPATSQFI